MAPPPVSFESLAVGPSAVLRLRGTDVVDVNRAACRELARRPGELLGSGFCCSLLPADREALTRASGAAADGTVARLDVRRPTEGVLLQSLELRLARDGDGSVLADVRDVTERNRLDAVVDCLATSTHTIDAAANLRWRPAANVASLGLVPGQKDGANSLETVHPDDLPGMLADFAQLLDQPGSSRVGIMRIRLTHLDQSWVSTRVTAVNRLDDPLIGGIIIRSEHQAPIDTVTSIRRTSGAFRSLAETAPIGIILTDRNGKASYFNPVARRLVGLDDAEMAHDAWTSRVRPDRQGVLLQVLADALERDTAGSTVVGIDRPDGTAVQLRIDVLPQHDHLGETYGVVATLRDVTAELAARAELLETQAKLERLANHDLLTGLPSRPFLVDRLERAMERTRRTGSLLAVLYCDLDGFKEVNDSLGHEAGDDVLVEATRRLTAAVRETDTVSRVGGDEFVIVCEGLDDQKEVALVASRIVAEIAPPLVAGGEVVTIGVSVGAAVAAPTTGADSLIRAADEAMYRAKSAGKGRFRLAPPPTDRLTG
jgi:diguanylate cyclase (GGDEF)-like protein/PAS domain S-box-containing protein